jgi:predicted RNA polymerase sigma factor
MELKTAGDAVAAWQVFEPLLNDHPDYIAAYAPAGELLVGLGRPAEARGMLQKGIAVAVRRNEAHARDHLESMLADLDVGK